VKEEEAREEGVNQKEVKEEEDVKEKQKHKR
jgi:hypothetical protein